ncbi:MAG: hypothetical protein HZB67_00430 [Candidatus Aenigmarchaeota archaeon]|nr:hypothetical protein [Candidatus Aenigmarchaeota archaeon]MBI5229508.1 hypothetical protein [Candidatus Micrarchaeota archaeon]
MAFNIMDSIKNKIAEKKEVSEGELNELFEEAVKRGAVLAQLHFDAYGEDKDAVKDALVEFVGRISNERGVLYCVGEIKDVIERKGQFSTYSEVKLLAADFESLLNISLKYGPVAVEILKPHKIELTVDQAQGLLLTASSTTQDYVSFLLQRVMKPEDFQKLQEHLKWRVEYGKKMVEGSETPKEENKSR